MRTFAEIHKLRRRVAVIVLSFFAIGTIAVLLTFSGCVVVYAPAAKTAAVQIHSQTSSNMTISESVPLSAKLADRLTGVSAGNGNSATILIPSAEAKLK